MISHKKRLLFLSLFTLSTARAMNTEQQPAAAATSKESEDAVIARFTNSTYTMHRYVTLPVLEQIIKDADTLMALGLIAVHDPKARSRRVDIVSTKANAQKLLDDGKYLFSIQ